MKQIILPEITNEINSSPAYAPLRQIYHSLILAQWFKRKIKYQIANIKNTEQNPNIKPEENIQNPYEFAIDKGYLKGLESELPWSKTALWQEYLESYQKGEYKLKDRLAGLNRMYWSGGMELTNIGPMITAIKSADVAGSPLTKEELSQFKNNQALGMVSNDITIRDRVPFNEPEVITTPAMEEETPKQQEVSSPLVQDPSASSAVERIMDTTSPASILAGVLHLTRGKDKKVKDNIPKIKALFETILDETLSRLFPEYGPEFIKQKILNNNIRILIELADDIDKASFLRGGIGGIIRLPFNSVRGNLEDAYDLRRLRIDISAEIGHVIGHGIRPDDIHYGVSEAYDWLSELINNQFGDIRDEIKAYSSFGKFYIEFCRRKGIEKGDVDKDTFDELIQAYDPFLNYTNTSLRDDFDQLGTPSHHIGAYIIQELLDSLNDYIWYDKVSKVMGRALLDSEVSTSTPQEFIRDIFFKYAEYFKSSISSSPLGIKRTTDSSLEEKSSASSALEKKERPDEFGIEKSGSMKVDSNMLPDPQKLKEQLPVILSRGMNKAKGVLYKTSVVKLKFLDSKTTKELAKELFHPRPIYLPQEVFIDAEVDEVHIGGEKFKIVGFDSGKTTLLDLNINYHDEIRLLVDILVEHKLVSEKVLKLKSLFTETDFQVVYEQQSKVTSTLFPSRGQEITLDVETGEPVAWRLESSENEYLLWQAANEALARGEEVQGSIVGGIPTNVQIRPGLSKEDIPSDLRNDRYIRPTEILLLKGHTHSPEESGSEPQLSIEDIIILAAETIVYRYLLAEVILSPADDNTITAVEYRIKPEKIRELTQLYPALLNLKREEILFVGKRLPGFTEWASKAKANPEDYFIKQVKLIDASSVSDSGNILLLPQLNLLDEQKGSSPVFAKGGIDLSTIELTLKDEKFVSSLNPADLKVLRAAKALKDGWDYLSLLYIHEIMLLIKDNLIKDIQNRDLLFHILKQLQTQDFLDPQALQFLQFIHSQEPLSEIKVAFY